MSRASTSLDLSEFFSNDDSDGHRLAEFLQNRRGGVRRQNFLFMNCEPQRMSLKVQLEKLPPSQQEENSEQIENIKEGDKCEGNIGEDMLLQIEKQMDILHAETEGASLPTTSNNPVVPGAQSLHSEPTSPISPVRPQTPLITVSPAGTSNTLKPLSPRLSCIRKSGGAVSPSDRLRRYSLKRLSKMGVGRRTLLQEFESTVSDSNFRPPLCSTPLSQPQIDNTPSSPTSGQLPDAENFEPNKTEKKSETCCGHTDTLIRTLQRKDEELKNYMENIDNTLKTIQSQEKEKSKTNVENDKTNAAQSHLKRTYTVEKGNAPGQVILTPDNCLTQQNSHHSKLLRSGTEPSTSQILKTPERSLNRSMISIRVKSPQELIAPRHLNYSMSQMESQSNQVNCGISNSGTKIVDATRSLDQQQQIGTSNVNVSSHELPHTLPPNNLSIVVPMPDVEIRETQKVAPARENSIVIQSPNREMSVVVIPINQTFNRTNGEENPHNNTIKTAKSKLQKNQIPPVPAQHSLQTAETMDQCLQLAEDNLKLTDILTDDEDETPKTAASRTIENNSQAPLNLAPSATNIRIKRLRKRCISRRKLQMDNSKLLSTETETKPSPQAYSAKGIVKRKLITLNKAPGMPLNGEKFAKELARMSNYDILDLRKRNSMGDVFAIAGRKSRRAQEEAVKQQEELKTQIEMELIRRQEVLDEVPENKYPPVPEEFRDSLPKQQQQAEYESLIDEKSSDRISFKNKRNSLRQHRRSTRSKEKLVPEVLKQYLEISKKFSQNKTRRNSFNKFKRSLYTQGQFDTEDNNSSDDKNSMEKTRSRSSSRNKKHTIPCIPSPPESDVEPITTLKVVSPPPPLCISPRKSLKLQQQPNAATINEVEGSPLDIVTEVIEMGTLTPLPPPPGFDNFKTHSNTNNVTQTTEITIHTPNTNHKHTDTNDDHIFKKPLQPAPKRRERKPKGSKTSSNNLLQNTNDTQQSADNSNDTTNGSLRRSKRGQVPLKNPTPIFQLLFQQTLNKRFEMMEKRHQKQKEKLREISRAEKAREKDPNQTITSRKVTKSSKPRKKRSQLPTVPEDETHMSLQHQDLELLNKKKAPKNIETKVKRKKNNKNKEHIQNNENFECSRLILNTPPPVDHLNNVFDQLRTTSTTLITPSPRPPVTAAAPPAEKVRPFKVRVARVKSATKPSVSESARNTSSSTTTTTSSCTTLNSYNSNFELISWLKNITESENSAARNEEIFKEMRISAASNLSFTELQGVEYAFYDTDEKASLGYLRFKPRQIKPKKKAKRFHLHFVTLVGNFRITANDKESLISVGDMVAIEKSVYYEIENITDDIGILMVVKK